MRRGAVLMLLLLASCGDPAPLALPTASPPATPSPTPTASPTPAPTPLPTPVAYVTQSGTALPPPPPGAFPARVTEVTDGDTVVLSGIEVGEEKAGLGRRARLIGVDTPEVYGGTDCYGPEASAFTKREILGRDVLVDFDVEKTDRYNRALVYIWTTEGVFFNGRLAAEGYAQQMTIPPNVRYAELFTALVREARNGDRGLWAGCVSEATPAPAGSGGGGNCDPSYPDVCIPPPPPDLDCGEIPHRRFTVRPPDPHGFDGDSDGVGCES